MNRPAQATDAAIDMLDLSVNMNSFLKGGKRVHGHSYIHVSLLPDQPDAVRILVDTARRRAAIDAEAFNVIRFSDLSHEIGLLHLPGMARTKGGPTNGVSAIVGFSRRLMTFGLPQMVRIHTARCKAETSGC